MSFDRNIKHMKYLSLFSGIGGFELGLQNSNYDFECIGFSEIDKYAISIYEKHFKGHKNYGDARNINTKELPDFDFLVGGFPCQSFSIAGKRKGFDDARGTLFFEIARILQDKKPRYFLLENVKGLLSHDKGKTFQTVLEILDELRYNVKWEVLNSKDFGVPQNRERVYIKGYSRERGCGREVLSVGRAKTENNVKINSTSIGENNTTARIQDTEAISNTIAGAGRNCGNRTLIKVNNGNHQSNRVYDEEGLSTTLSANGGGMGAKTGLYKINKVGNVSPSGHHWGDVFSTDGISRTLCARDFKSGVNIKEVISSTQKHATKTDGTVSPCLTEAMGKGGGHVPMLDFEDDFRIRKLTPRECERLQAFPDDWTAVGKNGEKISDTQRYKCCGNAVTTSVITYIINEMFKGVEFE